jgi:hypothetical protein
LPGGRARLHNEQDCIYIRGQGDGVGHAEHTERVPKSVSGAVVVPSFLAASMATPWEVATFVSVSMSRRTGPEFADRPEANSIGRTSTSAWDW